MTRSFAVAALALALTPWISADTAVIGAAKDNTLFGDAPWASNGVGSYFFAGNNGADMARRGLVAFDVAAEIPAGATICSVSLELTMSMTPTGAEPVELHRLTADWGEGASDAPSGEGMGGIAVPPDATWDHTHFDTEFWAVQGGDFLAEVSAVIPVAGVGSYVWSSPGMADDVAHWLAYPAEQFGWILIGNESHAETAKRFNSLQNSNASTRPRLIVEYRVSVPGDTNADGIVNVDDLIAVLGAWGPCSACDADLDCSGIVNVEDLLLVLGNWTR